MPDAAPPPIDLGTCVIVSLAGGGRVPMEEGVVIEVVPPGCPVQSPRVIPAHPKASLAVRYVVQCWSCRVLRREAQMIVVWL